MAAPILTNALAGLQKASHQLNNTARNIVEGASKEAELFQKLQDEAMAKQKNGAGAKATAPTEENSSESATTAPSRYIPSLAEEIVQLKLAAHAYKANAKLIKAAEELYQATSDALDGDDKG